MRGILPLFVSAITFAVPRTCESHLKPIAALPTVTENTMKRLQTATVAMLVAALLIVASLGAWTLGPTTARVFADQIGELAVAYNNAQLQRDFEMVYPQYRSRLPIQIDDRTTLVDLSHSGHVFRLRHLVETQRPRTATVSNEQTRQTMLAKACADEDMRATMRRGAIYEYQYLDKQARLLNSFDIRNADCEG